MTDSRSALSALGTREACGSSTRVALRPQNAKGTLLKGYLTGQGEVNSYGMKRVCSGKFVAPCDKQMPTGAEIALTSLAFQAPWVLFR